jgi:hypothetical protein
MAEHHPQKITLSELEEAVSAAVHQVQRQKKVTLQADAKGHLLMGRWIKEHLAEPEAKAAAEEITRQVSAKLPGLKGTPIATSGPGGSTMGFIMREE